MVSFADDCVGRVMSAIDEAGLAEKTLVICTSDHGGFAGEHGTVDKWDTMFYDSLIKVPLVMHFPPAMDQGRRIDALTDNVDIAPTVLELCGFESPEWIQGKSLAGMIFGRNAVHKDAVFCEGGVEKSALERIRPVEKGLSVRQQLLRRHPWTLKRARMIRTQKWKLVFRVDGETELYNLRDDPSELTSVSGLSVTKTVTHDLLERLLSWAIKTETDYPPIVELKA
jgi:choline-sulfatase